MMPQTAAAATRNKIIGDNEAAGTAASPFLRRYAFPMGRPHAVLVPGDGGPSLTCLFFISIMSSMTGKRQCESGEGEFGMTRRVSGRLLFGAVALSALTVLLSHASSWAMQGRMAGPACDGRAPLFVAARAGERAPYGISEGGGYGQQREVTSGDQAKKILEEYFSKKDVKIGKITEKNLYFEAEIVDKSGKVIDTVIVDKRTGRIRSIY